jgi:organic radical activating enzyme
MAFVAPPTAALAGIPGGLQAQGVWAGRRQLFVRFAAEAETATMYTADALANELRRSTSRSAFHSIAIAGRDPLANLEYLCAAFQKASIGLPVMLDTDGQRPDEIGEIASFVTMVQVTLEGANVDAFEERAFQTIAIAAKARLQHALVLAGDDPTSDARLLRLVERAHATSAATSIVVHPGVATPVDRDRRWISLFERIASLHPDARLALRIPPPTGMR